MDVDASKATHLFWVERKAPVILVQVRLMLYQEEEKQDQNVGIIAENLSKTTKIKTEKRKHAIQEPTKTNAWGCLAPSNIIHLSIAKCINQCLK